MIAPSTIPLFPVPQVPDKTAPSSTVSVDLRRIAQTMALLWTYRPRTAIHNLLGLLGFKRDDGRALTQDDVKRAIVELREHGWLRDMPGRDGYFGLHDRVRGALYREVLDEIPAATLRNALHRLDSFRTEHPGYHWPLYDAAATVALVRLELFSGAPARELERLRGLIQINGVFSYIVFLRNRL